MALVCHKSLTLHVEKSLIYHQVDSPEVRMEPIEAGPTNC